jgi:hypothetical protein
MRPVRFIGYRAMNVLFLPILLTACGEGGERPADTRPLDASVTPAASRASTAAADAATYPFRSAIVVMEGSMMADLEQVLYIDDYGRVSATWTTTEMTVFGQTMRSSSMQLNRDGWQYSVDLDERTGTRTRQLTPPPVGGAIDVRHLTKDMKERYKFRELERREFLGRNCEGYEMEVMGMKVRAWTWNQLPMYMETYMGGDEPMVLRVTSLEVDVAIQADKLQVPDDVEVVET